MDNAWIEIVVEIQNESLERAEAALHMATRLGLHIEDYSDVQDAAARLLGGDIIADELIAKNDGKSCVHVYFPPDSDRRDCEREVRDRLRDAGFYESGESGRDGYTIVSSKEVAEEDWANNWKEYFKPFRIGKRIIIRPQWISADDSDVQKLVTDGQPLDDADRIVGQPLGDAVHSYTIIGIDPGMAFGTGSHATTRLSLELLEDFICGAEAGAGNGRHIEVLDVGCGSGILSVAAVMLGACLAYGVDIDEYAVRNACENAESNGVGDKVIFAKGDLLDGIDKRFDLVISNIVADMAVRLLADVKNNLKPGGAVILSGIIDEREGDVTESAHKNGFEAVKTLRDEGWTAMLLRQTKLAA